MSSTESSNPDKLSGTTTIFNITLAVFSTLIVILFFYIFGGTQLSSTAIALLWLVIPMGITMLSIAMNAVNELIRCGSVNMITHLKVSWVTLVIVYIVLGITSISYIRAPVTSLFSGFFPDPTVLGVEAKAPTVRGVAVGYYMLFGVLLAQVITSGYGSICSK
jgi:hypothetical protein